MHIQGIRANNISNSNIDFSCQGVRVQVAAPAIIS